MIFFCFSSKDRHIIVEAILYHIKNYRIPVWYDRDKMLLGDERNYKNFVEGVEHSPYGIIILSPNSIDSYCANEEIDLMYEKYLNGTMHIFPIFFNISASEVPEKYKWLKNLVYKEIVPSIDVYSTCNHIICKFLEDELATHEYQNLISLEKSMKKLKSDIFISNLLQSYLEIDEKNFNSRISLLYAGCTYIECSYDLNETPSYYTAGFKKLFNETKLSLKVDLRDMLMIERLFLLLVSTVVVGNFVKNV
ncbi:toll/interleukin-1 receptor domain-containing protein [Saccharibacillus sp. JS10]|uniref:toll/interleukin-1 receptor domain-containing protein n=1 Tax=Saccharibacillus sp. JS10 TaxID=2950552 RepID=UPI00210B56A5|nr:toll/interleukin-1 receptor domain-containing protein [Saccharibacillus sp. JS10]MCQ4088505.1 toll/interleukin-1 receptor domain-containing protein [Saccharibacillus sp. JS10]